MKYDNAPSFEFLALMAALMSVVVLSIDALLPALQDIGMSEGVKNINDDQLIITMIFLGIGIGQFLLGALSDSFGRKPILLVGFFIFIGASILCINAKHFEIMIFGRVLQGFGLGAPRSLTISMARDCYSGNYMAKVISTISLFFLLVPIVAPTLGLALLNFFSWKSIFYLNIGFAILVVLWFWKRQSETLPKEKRIAFGMKIFTDGTRVFFKCRDAVVFTLISGFFTASFMLFLSTSEEIIAIQYHLADIFPYVFAALGICIAVGTYLNSSFVLKLGMLRITYVSIIIYTVTSILYVILFWSGKNPSLWILVTFLALQILSQGLMFGNLRALALEPLGHIAGIGAAINGCLSTVIAVPMANYVGSFVKGSALPVFIGFSVFGVLSAIAFKIWRSSTTHAKTKAP